MILAIMLSFRLAGRAARKPLQRLHLFAGPEQLGFQGGVLSGQIH
jgi:hypothetical protein